MKRWMPAVLAVVFLVTACGTDDEAAAPVAGGAGGQPETVELADGDYFGFVLGVDPSGRSITFDEATWITDDDAENGYRIEDPDPTTADLPVAATAAISVLTATGDPSTQTEVDLAELAEWFSSAAGDAAFDVTVADGTVTALAYRYRP